MAPVSETSTLTDTAPTGREALLDAFRTVRGLSERLARPLSAEDQTVQSMPDASPTKWHLAHTTWFFETFILKRFAPSYSPLDEGYHFLFNSYYQALGTPFFRPNRGLITRPTAAEVLVYRSHVDAAVNALGETAGEADWRAIAPLITLGLHHEQQHQELLCTDIKHAMAMNPLNPVTFPLERGWPRGQAAKQAWLDFEGGVRQIGHAGEGFAYDNEGPRHDVLVRDFRLAARPVTNGEFCAFIDDGGYTEPRHWLSDGWAEICAQNWQAPDYWRRVDGVWHSFTLHGLRPVDPEEPVTHVSYYEADAFARWAGKRLPSEAELELALTNEPVQGAFLDPAGPIHPLPGPSGEGLLQGFGTVWEWTHSPYTAYPGFAPAEGAVGEYNGKFMCNQFVLKGGSCATPPGHMRASYRNFFTPASRWQFSGVRLAEDG